MRCARSFANSFRKSRPISATSIAMFTDFVMPYTTGNVHPGFMGWVHGGGSPVGMLAEMLAAGLNANLGGRDHMPIEVERQIVEWTRQMFGFPAGASGIFVTGTSMANLMAVLVARTSALGRETRQRGVGEAGALLAAYTSKAAHGCITKAMEISGLGSDALRCIAVDDAHRMDVAALRAQIARDRAIGLDAVPGGGIRRHSRYRRDRRSPGDRRNCAARRNCGFTSTALLARLRSSRPNSRRILPASSRRIRSRSISTNGGRCPTTPASSWCATGRSIATPSPRPRPICAARRAGSPPGHPGHAISARTCRADFRALKTWFTLKTYGTEKLGAVIARCCALARYLEARVVAEPRLELLAPAGLNIVCFRYRAGDADAVNGEIVINLQESGIAAPSTTVLDGRLAIRAAIVNHRTDVGDIDRLVAAVLEFGARRTQASPDQLKAIEPPSLAM